MLIPGFDAIQAYQAAAFTVTSVLSFIGGELERVQ
jgi:hypothetical protein